MEYVDLDTAAPNADLINVLTLATTADLCKLVVVMDPHHDKTARMSGVLVVAVVPKTGSTLT